MDYRPIIESKYNRENWQKLLHDIFNGKEKFWATPSVVPTSSQFAKQALWLGTITLSDEQTIAIYEVELSDSVDIERNRRGIRDMLLTSWRNNGNAGAFMFCYRKNESVLRFSYVSESWNFADDGTYKKESTDTKRFTYLLGEGHRSRTAIQQFEKLRDSQLSLKDLTKAFSVEAVSDMFFNGYKKQYEDIIFYVTGKRMVKVANKWEERQEGQPCQYIMQQFSNFPNPEKSIRDYVKKLMGRLVFLQFLQKKGWLGVPVNAEWGEGDPEFILNLYDSCNDKDLFIDNVLEALFNDLNSERTNDLVSSAVGSHIRVPYLNGGLFEREATDETEFPLPAKYMQSLLDFFASYNFTIDENDPDDAEVGVDPEMLGRIFENLLEDNKDKGAFYTPKEIVSYMCRESLIAYLQTGIEDEPTKEAIRQFVTTHDVSTLGTNDKFRQQVDEALKNVKICDPAIGSGAFPMGLLKELFQCRTALEGISQQQAAEIKKHIIQQNIYGVDIERGAVDIARLRFWLSLIVDEETPQALPNLDYKIVEGNSLITTFDGQYIDLSLNWLESKRYSIVKIRPEKKALQAEQKRFFTLSGDDKYRSEIAIKNHILNIIWYQLDYEKHSWKDATIEQAGLFGATTTKGRKKNAAQVVEFTQERQTVLDKCEKLMGELNDESKLLQERARINIPFFEWQTVFSDVFEDDNKRGFDIVIGNPPYVSAVNMARTEHEKIIFKTIFPQATGAYDLYVLFLLQGCLLSKNVYTWIIPNKFLIADYAKKTFEKLKQEGLYRSLDVSVFNVFKEASVYPIILNGSKLCDLEFKVYNLDVYKNLLFNKMVEQTTVTCDDTIDSCGIKVCSGATGFEAQRIKEFVTEYHTTNTIPFTVSGNIDRYSYNNNDVRYMKDRYSTAYLFLDESIASSKKAMWIMPKIIIAGMTKVIEATYVDSPLAIGVGAYAIYDFNSISPYYILGLLNSRYTSYYLRTKFKDKHLAGGYLAINKSTIEKLPFRLAENDIQEEIGKLAKKILDSKIVNPYVDTRDLESQIDKLVYQIYNLTEAEIIKIEQ